jgi:hypothetical protein
MANTLIAALPSSGPIFAYNASFEAGVLEFLAYRVSSAADTLRAYVARLVDLLPVTKEAYYHRDMKGSWSIKSVVPTIAAELGYEHLGKLCTGVCN